MRIFQVSLFAVMLLIAGYKSMAYFNLPNDLLKESATVYLDGGIVKEGTREKDTT